MTKSDSILKEVLDFALTGNRAFCKMLFILHEEVILIKMHEFLQVTFLSD